MNKQYTVLKWIHYSWKQCVLKFYWNCHQLNLAIDPTKATTTRSDRYRNVPKIKFAQTAHAAWIKYLWFVSKIGRDPRATRVQRCSALTCLQFKYEPKKQFMRANPWEHKLLDYTEIHKQQNIYKKSNKYTPNNTQTNCIPATVEQFGDKKRCGQSERGRTKNLRSYRCLLAHSPNQCKSCLSEGVVDSFGHSTVAAVSHPLALR